MVYGVASWRGQGLHFTDGLCHTCATAARAELGFHRGSTASSRWGTAVVAALFFMLAPEVLNQFPASVMPWPAAVRPAALVPAALGVREASAGEPPAPVPDVAAVLAMVTGAASAVDGPVAEPPARSSSFTSTRALLAPTRSELRAYDDPASPLAAHRLQAP